MRRLIAISAAAVMSLAWSGTPAAQSRVDRQAADMLALLVKRDLDGAMNRDGSRRPLSLTWHVPVQTTPQEIYLEYQRNEVRADQRFKGADLAILGSVLAVRRAGNEVYAEMAGTGYAIENVKAFLDARTASDAAAWNVGTRVALVCRGDGMSIFGPVLRDCMAYDRFRSAYFEAAEASARQWLAGDQNTLFQWMPDWARASAFRAYWLLSTMPATSDCRRFGLTADCLAEMESRKGETLPHPSPAYRRAHEARMAELGLPNIPQR